MNKISPKFPASHWLAVEEKSFVKDTHLLQRCDIELNGNIRSVITKRHWKPTSKIIE